MIDSLIIGFLLNLFLAAGAWVKQSVTPLGALLGLLLGAGLYWTGGFVLWMALTFFFISSTLIGRFSSPRGGALERIIKKGGRRDWVQVFANVFPAFALACCYAATKDGFWLTASYAALAASTADTWGSEVGVFSSREPRSILTGKPVEAGISGGVTPLGTAASLAGALLLAALSLASGAVGLFQGALIMTSGFLGSLIDSLLGAGLQVKYRDSAYGYLTEQPDGNAIVTGVVWMTNDMVNLMSSTAAGGIALLMAILF